MQINKVTFTGADDNTNYQDLLDIQKEYPFVEWGILFSGNRKGTPKYPTQDWIDNLPGELNLAAHFCGKYARQIIESSDFDEVEQVFDKFNRVQLNYTFNKLTNLTKLSNELKHYAIDFIFQYNNSNSETLQELMNTHFDDNINFLYDSSGGNGVEIKEIKTPFKYYTGYSGGIGPENVESIVKTIQNFPDDSQVYIDMEGKVRTGDLFDLDKVKQVLEKFKNIKDAN